MSKIGLLSDTHGFLDPTVFEHFQNCDEIWHAGDMGSTTIVTKLESFKPFRGVYGNIDNYEIQAMTSLNSIFEIAGLKVFMTHIGGYPEDILPEFEPSWMKFNLTYTFADILTS